MQLTATAPTMSPADISAHRAASYVRAHDPGDPDPDEALRRARADTGVCPFCHGPNIIGHTCASLSPDVEAALTRVTTRIAYLLRDRQADEGERRELAGAA